MSLVEDLKIMHRFLATVTKALDGNKYDNQEWVEGFRDGQSQAAQILDMILKRNGIE
jgi:hypothetical protein